jgi:hypothetical protein
MRDGISLSEELQKKKKKIFQVFQQEQEEEEEEEEIFLIKEWKIQDDIHSTSKLLYSNSI